MSGVIVNYNNNALTSMSSSGTKTLLTSGKYCEGNFEVVYSGPKLANLYPRVAGEYGSDYLKVLDYSNGISSGTTTYSLGVDLSEQSNVELEIAVDDNSYNKVINETVVWNGETLTVTGTNVSVTIGIEAIILTTTRSDLQAIAVYATNYDGIGSVYLFNGYTSNPSISLSSSTGVITASHTTYDGFYSGAIDTSSTYSLPIQAAQTLYPSTTDQTISSYRWLTGAQTIKSVTTSNLTAANIASGVTVKVGDANNASRITQVTGTYAPATSSLTVTPTEASQTFNATGVYGYKPVTVNAISSTYVGTGVTTRDVNDINWDLDNGYIGVPSGYYSDAVPLYINTVSHPKPTIGISSTTGVVTATHQMSVGRYIPTTYSSIVTSTYNLTTQAAQTIYPSTTAQYVNSYRWLTGSQTIASVTTSNLTAENIAEGVVVKVGDAANASRITQVTGTHKGGGGHDAILLNDGTYNDRMALYTYVNYNGTRYYTNEDTFNFNEGDTIETFIYGTKSSNVYLNNTLIGSDMTTSFSAPSYPLAVYFSADGIYFNKAYPSGTLSITSNGTYNVYGYSSANVSLPTQAAQTFYVSTADQTISSGVYLTGTQTIKSVTTSNLTASNIASGVTVKIGDAEDESRIAQITGTYEPAYYQAFRSIACKNVIDCSATYMQEYFNSLSIISSYQFADCTFSASDIINFPNVSEIYSLAFASQEAVIVGNNTISFNFPSLSYMPYNTTNFEEQFLRNGRITHVSMPIVPNITSSMFQSCNGLLSVYAPNVTSIGAGAFSEAQHLQIADYSICSYIAREAFYHCYSLSSINFPNCSYVGRSAFAYCSNLTSASFPECTTVDSSAFYYCINLIDSYFPKCTTIRYQAFSGCTKLTTIDALSCISIGDGAFYSCLSLSSINFSKCTYIGATAFGYCTNLTSVNFPECTTVSTYAFRNCYNLINASFPQCLSIGNYAFNACSSLQSISFPNCTRIGDQGFYNCINLQIVSFPKCSYVSYQAFYGCSSLSIASFPNCEVFGAGVFSRCFNLVSLYLNNVSSVPTFGTYMFNSTPIGGYSTYAGRYGSIFVPSSLYAEFTTATSWKAYSARMVSI